MDHSPIHSKKGDDSLNAKRMNVRPGGKQPLMEDGWYEKNGVKVHLVIIVLAHFVKVMPASQTV